MHEFFPENLRNPARSRRAGLMRQFRPGQVYSSLLYSGGEGAAFPIIIIFCTLHTGRGPADGLVIRAHAPTIQAVGNSTVILKHLFHE